MDTIKAEEGEPGASESSSERYFCPFPGCKRSFAELWRLKVHYRAPPDIRGSGKERGHGTELTHCPKCGKGLKPGKHHVGCSGGKGGPRQNKRSRLANAASAGATGLEGLSTNMYTLQMQYGQAAASLPNGFTAQQLGAGFQQQQQQFMPQQYQADLSGAMYAGQVSVTAAGSLAQQQGQFPQLQQAQQQQQQSPALSMGIMSDQMAAGMGTTLQQGLAGAGSGMADMSGLLPAGQGYYQQQPMQAQLSLDASGMTGLQPAAQQGLGSMQSGQLQDTLGVAHTAPPFGMTASAALMGLQQQQQQVQADYGGLYAGPSSTASADAAAAAAVPAGTVLLPAQVQQVAAVQMVQQPAQQEQSPQLMAAGLAPGAQPGAVQLNPAGSGLLVQQQQLMMAPVTGQQAATQQQLLPQPQMQLQQQQLVPGAQPSAAAVTTAQALAPATSGSLQSTVTTAVPVMGAGSMQQVLVQQQPQVQAAGGLQPQQQPQLQQSAQQQQQQMPPPPPVQTQISSSLFDEIDGGFGNIQPPSPPPLPADFPAASGTLFNFAQFSQKLPAAQPPSAQMAMMPRGMQQELPASMDDLWTPEATYDHHSDGDLMQLLFGAPEQPPTMATIHLHHFLDDDACSSPGLLAGILGGSMDDLHAAAAAAATGAADGGATAGVAGQGQQAAGVSTAMVAPEIPPPPQQQQQQQQVAVSGQGQQEAAAGFVPVAVKAEQQQHVNSNGPAVLPQPPQPQEQQQQVVYSTVPVPVNGMNGLNGLLPNGPCSSAALQLHMSVQLNKQQQDLAAAAPGAGGAEGCMPIKAESGDATLLTQKAVVAGAAMPGAVAGRAN